MLKNLYSRNHALYTSLPILGPILDGFVAWAMDEGYSSNSLRLYVPKMVHLDQALREQGLRRPSEITRELVEKCWADLWNQRRIAGVACLHRYLTEKRLIQPAGSSPPQTSTGRILLAFHDYLKEVRGFQPKTIRTHLGTAYEFLVFLTYEESPARLASVGPSEIEAFVQQIGERLSRASLQHTVGCLRSWLRFLAAIQIIKPGLDSQIDSPRHFRLEKLPRVYSWRLVQDFLQSIDCSTLIGLRDYTAFFLIATYGLRASEASSLTLDDVDWRARKLRVRQPKTNSILELPLTDGAGSVLAQYLRRRPKNQYRELFLRSRPPLGPLKGNAIGMKFNAWARRSDLPISGGVHTLRHSYATHLLRLGTPLKTIGDLLGHRCAESTAVYLRLDLDDLRDVPLQLPPLDDKASVGEES